MRNPINTRANKTKKMINTITTSFASPTTVKIIRGASELLIPVFLQELTPNLPSLMLFLKEDMEQNIYLNFFY
jgi:hypothetical protein